MLRATLDGAAQCRVCGRSARLDLLSRWMISCVLAVLLPNVLLYGGVFYSGHVLVFSMFIVYAGWAALSFVGFPFLTLEAVAAPSRDRSHSLLLMGVLLVAAIIMDGFIASRIEADNAHEAGRATSGVQRDRYDRFNSASILASASASASPCSLASSSATAPSSR
jgi:hypothetical protein